MTTRRLAALQIRGGRLQRWPHVVGHEHIIYGGLQVVDDDGADSLGVGSH